MPFKGKILNNIVTMKTVTQMYVVASHAILHTFGVEQYLNVI